MNAWLQFRQLSLWSKIAVFGSAASVLSFISWAIVLIVTAEPDVDIKFVKNPTLDGNRIEFSLKNSGTDTAYITGIRFVFEPVTIGNTACAPIGLHRYEYTLFASIESNTVEISPTYKAVTDIFLKRTYSSDGDFNNWKAVMIDTKRLQSSRDEVFVEAEEAINVDPDVIRVSRSFDFDSNTSLESLFALFPNQEYTFDGSKTVVYFVDDRWLFEHIIIVRRLITQESKPLNPHVKIPYKDVARIGVEFFVPKNYFSGCSEIYTFRGHAILEYDGRRKIRTPDFQFSLTWRNIRGDTH